MIPPNYAYYPPAPFPWTAFSETAGHTGSWSGPASYGAPMPPPSWNFPPSTYYLQPHPHGPVARMGMAFEEQSAGINWAEVLIGAAIGAIFGAVARKWIG